MEKSNQVNLVYSYRTRYKYIMLFKIKNKKNKFFKEKEDSNY